MAGSVTSPISSRRLSPLITASGTARSNTGHSSRPWIPPKTRTSKAQFDDLLRKSQDFCTLNLETRERLTRILNNVELKIPVLAEDASYRMGGHQPNVVAELLAKTDSLYVPKGLSKLLESDYSNLKCGIFSDYASLWWAEGNTLNIWHWIQDRPSRTESVEESNGTRQSLLAGGERRNSVNSSRRVSSVVGERRPSLLVEPRSSLLDDRRSSLLCDRRTSGGKQRGGETGGDISILGSELDLPVDEDPSGCSPGECFTVTLGDEVCGAAVTCMKFDVGLADCFPDVAELEMAISMEGQLAANGSQNVRNLRFGTMLVVTASKLQKFLIVGNSQAGIVDCLPLWKSGVPFDGYSLSCITHMKHTERFYLADIHGGLYEYTTSFVNQVYLDINFSKGGKLKARPGGLISSVFNGMTSASISPNGAVTKLLDIRKIRDRINVFGTGPYIKQLVCDIERGRIFALSTHSEVYLISVSAWDLSMNTTGEVRVNEGRAIGRREALITHTSLINSLHMMSFDGEDHGASLPGDQKRFLTERKNRLKNSLSVLAMANLGGQNLLVVLSDGSRLVYHISTRSLNQIRLSNPTTAGRSAESANIWYDGRSTDLTDVEATLISVRLPPPGLVEISPLKSACVNDVLYGVSRCFVSIRSGGLILMEVALKLSSTSSPQKDPCEERLIAIVPDLPTNDGIIHNEIYDWIYLDKVKRFKTFCISDLPLPEGFSTFEAGMDYSKCINCLQDRLSLFLISKNNTAQTFVGSPPRPLEYMDFLTSTMMLPGPSFISLVPEGLVSFSRLRPYILNILEQETFVNNLLNEIINIFRIPSSSGITADNNPPGVVRLLQIHTNQKLPTLTMWASNQSSQILNADHRDSTLDILWHCLIQQDGNPSSNLDMPDDIAYSTRTNHHQFALDIINRPVKKSSSVDVILRLMILVPILASFTGKNTNESPRIQSLLRTISRILQPFYNTPLFKLQTYSPKFAFVRATQDNSAETSASVPSSKKRVLKNQDQSSPILLKKKITNWTNWTYHAKDIEVKLVLRFSSTEFNHAHKHIKALLNSIGTYEDFLLMSAPSELRIRTAEDLPRLSEIKMFLTSAAQLLGFLACFATASEIKYADSRVIESSLFDKMATQTFSECLSEIHRNQDSSIFKQWLHTELTQSPLPLISASDLLITSPQMFGSVYLSWQSVLEPLRYLSTRIKQDVAERRRYLHVNKSNNQSSPRKEPMGIWSCLTRQSPGKQPQLALPPNSDGANLESNKVTVSSSLVEYLWNAWLNKCPDIEEDLMACLPLPDILQSGAMKLDLLGSTLSNLEELRGYMLKAILCFCSISSSSSPESVEAAGSTLLSLAYAFHCYDIMALILGIWYHNLQRNGGSGGEFVLFNRIGGYLDRLKKLSEITDGWMGVEIAEEIVVQLTRRSLPSLSNLVHNKNKPTIYHQVIYDEDDDMDSLLNTFDSSRLLIEENLAHNTFLWIASNGGTFPRSLTSLNSVWLSKWLDKIPATTDQIHQLPTSGGLSYCTILISIINFFISENNYTMAQEYLEKLINEQPRWLNFPIDIHRLAALSVESKSKEAVNLDLPVETFNIGYSGVSQDEKALETDLREVFRERWMNFLDDDWKLVVRFYNTCRRVGDLSIDVRLGLLEKLMRPDNIYNKLKLQSKVLDDVLLFTALLINNDGDISSMIIDIIREFSGLNNSEVMVDITRKALVNNLLTFLISIIHITFPSIQALLQATIDFILSLKGFAPFPTSTILEVFLMEGHDRIITKLFSRLFKTVSFPTNLSVTIVSVYYSYRFAAAFITSVGAALKMKEGVPGNSCLGFFEHYSLKFYNIYSAHHTPKDLEFLSFSLFLISDRILRASFNEHNINMLNTILTNFFLSPAQSHSEKLRCVNYHHLRFNQILPLQQNDLQDVPIGSLSGYAIDTTLRNWMWDLVGLTRDTNGHKIPNPEILVLQPIKCLKVLKPAIEYNLSSIANLQTLLLIMTDNLAGQNHALLTQFIHWLDKHIPLKPSFNSQHLTLTEVAYALAVCLNDLVTLILWFTHHSLPLFEQAIRISGTGAIITFMPSTDVSNALAIPNKKQLLVPATNFVHEVKEWLKIFNKDQPTNVDGKDSDLFNGWKDIAHNLSIAGHKINTFFTDVALKQAIERERQETGWDSDSTKLLQNQLLNTSQAIIALERDILPGLQVYAELIRIYQENLAVVKI